MTNDQIKAIAEEYAEQLTLKDVNTEDCVTKSGAISVLKFLSTRYCIVEREKVMRAYRENSYFAENPMNPSDSYCQGVIYTLTNLFGTSMFNQNEE